MAEIINWIREKKSEFYVVHTSAFRPNNYYFSNLQLATQFFNTLMLFIGVHHSSDEDMMGPLFDPGNIEDFSTLRFRSDWPDDADDDEMIVIFDTNKYHSSEEILYRGTLIPPYNDIKIKGPNYQDYIGIWKGRSYLPSPINDDESHIFNHSSSQVTFIKGWWLETLGGTYELSLGKINIDE